MKIFENLNFSENLLLPLGWVWVWFGDNMGTLAPMVTQVVAAWSM